MEIKIFDHGYKKRLRELGKEGPVFRKYPNDCGCDLYCLEDVTIQPQEVVNIGTGLGVEVPPGMAAFIIPRTSMAIKGASSAFCAIDTGFTGEVHNICSNLSSEPITIKAGDRMASLAFFHIATPTFIDSKERREERGEGAFGSTGK